jgi:hypothetical protein
VLLLLAIAIKCFHLAVKRKAAITRLLKLKSVDLT